MGMVGIRLRFVMAIMGSLAVVGIYSVGCAPETTPRARATDEDAGKKKVATNDEEEEEAPSTSSSSSSSGDPDRIPVPDPPTDPDAGDAGTDAMLVPDATVTDCTGKPNGTTIATAAAENRCCEGVPADLTKSGNCGACGITCAGGTTCSEIAGQPGKYSCKGCTTNDSCVAMGFGMDATCYLGGGGFCNCQGVGAACKGGATCKVVSGNNYCAY